MLNIFNRKRNDCAPAVLYKKIVTAVISILLLLIGTFDNSMGGDGGIYTPIISKITGIQIIAGNSAMSTYAPDNAVSVKLDNVISLTVTEANPGLQDFTATVRVNINYGESSTVYQTASNIDLQVSYNKGSGVKYNAKNMFAFKGAKYVKVSVVQVTSSVSGIKTKLLLENTIHVTSYYDLPSANAPAPQWKVANTPAADELRIDWKLNDLAGNNVTQIEWTWLSDEFAANYTQGGVVNTDMLFADNTTRVDVSSNINNYTLPLLYDGAGTLYYRVRYVNVKPNGNRSDGPWGVVRQQTFAGHQNNLNWQASTSFAEDGKRKTVVQYFDGSLRSRETVTKSSTDTTSITAETIYDNQGRPAVQVLPAPKMNGVIEYSIGINQFNQQSGINDNPAKYFDLQSSIIPNTLVTTTPGGASQYYSTNNPQLSSGNYNSIPDAEGYPYTLTRYTPDATGRVLSQSGVGATFKMGGGHDTKYYYGTAAQEEIDGLFGTEAGNFSHYFKNMVQDANGQMSVNYTDMHGRTIATALAGDSPVNLRALVLDNTNYPGQGGTLMTRNLLSGGSNLVKSAGIEAVNTLLVPFNTLYTFSYKITPEALALTNCNSSSFCNDCMYSLAISITDDAGEADPIVWRFNNVNLSADENCATAPGLLQAQAGNPTGATINSNTITVAKSLLAGSYTVRKTLTPSESALEKYKAAWADPAAGKGLCKTEQDLIDSVYNAQVLLTPCALNTPAPAVTCPGNLCNVTVTHTLDNIKRQMLADVTPGGQYAVASVADAPAPAALPMPQPLQGTAMYNKYNIFSTLGGAGTQPYYRYPWSALNTPDYYKDVFGVKDAQLYPLGTEAASSPIAADAATFRQNFVTSWANQLLPHHPEYPRYLKALSLQTTYDYADNMLATTTYAAAATAGYVFSGGTTGAPNTDPFYSISGTPSGANKTDAKKWVGMSTGGYQDNLSMWQIATGNATGCNTLLTYDDRKACMGSAPVPGSTAFNALTTTQKDAAWNNFNGLYVAARSSQVSAYLESQSSLTDADELVREGYQLHFPKNNAQAAQQMEWQGYPATEGGAPTIPAQYSSVTAVYGSRCDSYIENWKQQLLQCATLANLPNVTERDAILNEITTGMAAVCKKGSDEANPYGSSNVAPTIPGDGTPRSFEEVIVAVYKAHGIINSNGIYTDGFCNPFVINYPKPYGKGEQLIPALTGTIDTCNCKQYKLIEGAAQTANYTVSDFASMNAYLRFKYQDTLTLVMYNALRSCSPTGVVVATGTATTCQATPVNYPPGGSASCPVGQTPGNCPPLNAPVNQDPKSGNYYTSINCQVTTPTYTYAYTYPLSSPQPMPRFLQCGYTENPLCVSCEKLSYLTAEYRNLFTAPTNTAPSFGTAALTDDQVTYNGVYERFINYRTGLSFTWQQYGKAAADNGCTVTQLNTGVTTNVICGDSKPITDTTGMFVKETPCAHTYAISVDIAQNIYRQRKEKAMADFEAAYRAKCLSAKDAEQFTVTYNSKEYHYTLYYYDMAGNLVKTVPPRGVKPDFTNSAAVKAARAAGTVVRMPHTLTSNYSYNTLNAVVAQQTPDGGSNNFWYDNMGRLVLSQNDVQSVDNAPGAETAAKRYSYTLYDALGRITEVGEKPYTTTMTTAISRDPVQLTNWLNAPNLNRVNLTQTVYDLPFMYDLYADKGLAPYMTQKNLRNRVSYTMTKKVQTQTDVDPTAATYYTYDIHGNVDTLLQNYKGVAVMEATGNRNKLITYDYDLISGKVNSVDYQPTLQYQDAQGNTVTMATTDAFYHRYSYDGENRLITVETSRDKLVWEQDATYSYYKHGPLARTEIGELKVQGLDYTYTLQGWMKSVNTVAGMGIAYQDEALPVARDAYSFSLNYYAGDYKPIGNPAATANIINSLGTNAKGLYNGNIAAMAVNIPKLGTAAGVYNYKYDQLNRLVSQDVYGGLNISTGAFSPTVTQSYKEALTYDPNGNIATYLRNGTGTTQNLNNYQYTYPATSNRLTSIANSVNSQTGTYTYDAIGNVLADGKQGVTTNTWSVYGKLRTVQKSSGNITYEYDAGGNRMSKTIATATTAFVRDATGNIMAVYEGTIPTTGTPTIKRTETDIYGSSRLGLAGETTTATSTVTLAGTYGYATVSTIVRGEKNYELTNHLGNVLANISDKPLPVSTDGTTIAYNIADVITAQDYSSFGAVNRSFNPSGVTNAFNGQRLSPEISTTAQTATYWEYNGDVGRRWNRDPRPVTGFSEYSTFGNNPILINDLLGDTLNNKQLVDALKIANNEVKDALKSNRNYFGKEKDKNLLTKVMEYSEKNNLTFEDVAEFKGAVENYHNGLVTVALWGKTTDLSKLDELVINNKNVSNYQTLIITIGRIREVEADMWTVMGHAINSTLIVSMSALFPEVGTGPRGVFKSNTQQRIAEISAKYDQNSLYHIFGKSEHALNPLILKYGSTRNAYAAVQDAANSALRAGQLTPNVKGILPNGDAGNVISVGGMSVRLIGGRVQGNKVLIASFSRKGLP